MRCAIRPSNGRGENSETLFMATPLSASSQISALEDEGCRVVEYRSWRTHNRNHKGSWGPVYGVMIHHTVTSGTDASVELCYEGHSSLPGPLCHTVGAKDGTLYMVGNGRANHAGSGDGDVLRAVINEASLPPDNEANTDGNRHFYGIELINRGDGRDPWPEAQVDAAARWAAALCRAHGWNERSVIGHLEWQPGKVDPRGFTMNSFRTRVRALLDRPAGTGNTTDPNVQEDDVPDTLGLYDPDDRTIPPGEWTQLPVERNDLITGATAYALTVHVDLVAPAGGTVQGRYLHVRPDGSVWQSAILERSTTGGTTFADFPHSGSVHAEEKVRFEFVYYPAAEGDTEPAAVKTRRARGLYWK